MCEAQNRQLVLGSFPSFCADRGKPAEDECRGLTVILIRYTPSCVRYYTLPKRWNPLGSPFVRMALSMAVDWQSDG